MSSINSAIYRDHLRERDDERTKADEDGRVPIYPRLAWLTMELGSRARRGRAA